MEPERNIEKLLKAYAKKRRDQAGEPLKLDGTARRRLQDAVARNASQPEDEGVSLSLWEVFRRQWAFFVSFAVILFFAPAIFFPVIGNVKNRGQQYASVDNLKQIGAAAQALALQNHGRLPESLDALTNQLGGTNILTEAESGKRYIYVAGGKDLNSLPNDSVLAYSPTAKRGRVVLFADRHVEILDGKQFSELTNRKTTEVFAANNAMPQSLAETPPPSPSVVANGSIAPAAPAPNPTGIATATDATKLDDQSAVTKDGLGGDSPKLAVNAPAAAAGNFRQLSSLGAQNQFRNISSQNKTAAVLANFQVQQNGNNLRVVDADGSVYDGTLIAQAIDKNIPTERIAAGEKKSYAPFTPHAKPGVKREISQAEQNAQNYDFQVSGLNQTLKQNVVFNGNFLAISNVTTNLQQAFGGGQQSQSNSLGDQTQANASNAVQWLNSRISGTAIIDNSNNIEINAVPAP